MALPFSDFGQQFLFLLFDGIRYLGQSGLAMTNGSLHVFQLLLKFCTLDFQLGQLWIGPEGGVLQVINQLHQLFSLLPIRVPPGQQGFAVGQISLRLFHLQSLIFKDR